MQADRRPVTVQMMENYQRSLPTTPNKKSVCQKKVLQCLIASVCKKRPKLWQEPSMSWLFHHDNVPSHNVLSILGSSSLNDSAVLYQLSYFSGLARCEVFFFSKSKWVSKGGRYENKDVIEKAERKVLQVMLEETFQAHIRRSMAREKTKCIGLEREHFEGEIL